MKYVFAGIVMAGVIVSMVSVYAEKTEEIKPEVKVEQVSVSDIKAKIDGYKADLKKAQDYLVKLTEETQKTQATIIALQGAIQANEALLPNKEAKKEEIKILK